MPTPRKAYPFLSDWAPPDCRTKVEKKTYAPDWSETFLMSYSPPDPPPLALEVEVYDRDAVGSGREFIGRLVVSLGDLVEEEVQGWFDLQASDGWPVRGHDKNSSAIHLVLRLDPGIPEPSWWDTRPDWLLAAVRVAAAAWGLLGAGIWIREGRLAAAEKAKTA